MRPKIVDVNTEVAAGIRNEGVFVTFVESTRKSKLMRSVIRKFLLREAPIKKDGGLMKKFRPVFPIEPGAGWLNLARDVASNQKLRPLSKINLPSSREQPLQSASEPTTLLKVFNPEYTVKGRPD